jgi:hypothetical protein
MQNFFTLSIKVNVLLNGVLKRAEINETPTGHFEQH